MKKAMTVIAIFAAVILSIAAHTDRVYGPQVGYKAPDLTLENGDRSATLSEMRGGYVLLTFWSAADAQSRLNMMECERTVRQADKGQLSLLAVNLDSSERLFREIVRRDRLSEDVQFNVKGDQMQRIAADYHLDKGLSTYLINGMGEIVAVNPSTLTMQQLGLL